MTKKIETKFKVALNKLERAVKRLEDGEIDLEKSVDVFVEGMENAAFCQNILNESERKVEIVIANFAKAKEALQEFDKTELYDEE